MSSSVLYRISSILLVLFAAGHTLGFRKTDPRWGVDTALATLRAIHFDAQGFDRTYWDFYVGFGLFVSVLLVFAAIVAWQLGGMSAETLASMQFVAWGLSLCFGAVTFLSWNYFFVIPGVFSSVITLCLLVAAWLSRNPK